MKKPTILFLVFIMIFAALPAFAQDKADWAFYGSVRMWTAWEAVDEDTPPQLSSIGTTGSFFQNAVTRARAYTIGGTPHDDADLAWMLQGNSRVGANVKWGDITGAFEYGTAGGWGANSSVGDPNLRLLYGRWNFGPGSFQIGQDYGTYDYRVANICGPGGAECNGIGLGSIYAGRLPMLRLIMGGFKFSLESVRTTAASFSVTTTTPITPQTILLTSNQTAPPAGSTFVETDWYLPRIAASYTFNAGPGQFFIGGQYNAYKEIYNVGGVERDNTVYGWTLGAGTKLSFGPFYTNATVQYGQNPNNAGSGPATLYPSVQLYNPLTDTQENADYMAAQLILGYKLTDSITFEGGVIWQGGDVQSPQGGGFSVKQNTWTYYLQMAFSPAKNVFIIPEIGVIDYDKLRVQDRPDLNYGKLSWLGIKWQINF
jgi:hypothetical protein